MDGQALYQIATKTALELPGSEIYDFAPQWKAARVGGKWFALFTILNNEHLVTVKADPAEARALIQEFTGITTGYHMNKKHWISLHPDPDLDGQLVTELVIESYLIVVSLLPRSERPVDPADNSRALSGRSACISAHI
ncbi:MmcQ/YjbR family DNA-binding protein [Schaalia sp. lx-100]|uniref:MmcQ/YjbR family DNA-binding protein n=1 Tax=Schaalia sp. lx-100 TaxID=2899081 RepID=UPI001E5391A1|nr:MmcQ/YjbR family DNA-binding protein [Schaalia sp. lx-100]MCD4557590.1 MmcQ/YjbR family DNA-binding protein [Schaalia sp. lx-100]